MVLFSDQTLKAIQPNLSQQRLLPTPKPALVTLPNTFTPWKSLLPNRSAPVQLLHPAPDHQASSTQHSTPSSPVLVVGWESPMFRFAKWSQTFMNILLSQRHVLNQSPEYDQIFQNARIFLKLKHTNECGFAEWAYFMLTKAPRPDKLIAISAYVCISSKAISWPASSVKMRLASSENKEATAYYSVVELGLYYVILN